MSEMSALDIMDRYGALGPDFLTWLWVHSLDESLPAPPSEPGLAVGCIGPMVFESEIGDATKISLAGDEAATAPEAKAALRTGKRLKRSKLEFSAQDAKWTFTLDSDTFDLRSIKLPVPKVADLDEYMTMRVQATQHLAHIVHELFEIFLTIRLDAAKWKEELENWNTSD